MRHSMAWARGVSSESASSVSRSRPTAADGWTLAWSDEFDGTTLGAEWETRLAGQRFGRRRTTTIAPTMNTMPARISDRIPNRDTVDIVNRRAAWRSRRAIAGKG